MGQKESHHPASSVSLSLDVSRTLVFFPNSPSCMSSQVQAWRVDGTLAASPHRALSPATRHTVGEPEPKGGRCSGFVGFTESGILLQGGQV